MWSKNKLKFVRSMAQKKYRDSEGAFLAEGPKVIDELAVRFRCRLLVATSDYLKAHPGVRAAEVDEVSQRELEQASCLNAPQGVLAVFDKPETAAPFTCSADSLTLVLDGVQDPGNLGTIIRLADWFGVRDVICSRDTADAFSPKVVQATMGALARVNVTYGDLPCLLDALPEDFPVYGTFMEGDNLYASPLSAGGLLVMGNEGKGISPAVAAKVNRRIHIPNYPPGGQTVESLNVAVATAVACAEFRRRVAGY